MVPCFALGLSGDRIPVAANLAEKTMETVGETNLRGVRITLEKGTYYKLEEELTWQDKPHALCPSLTKDPANPIKVGQIQTYAWL